MLILQFEQTHKNWDIVFDYLPRSGDGLVYEVNCLEQKL